jgi:hypothetical protein
MMEHYVTLFDSLFLPQGLALHISMERHVKYYTLWILCVDDPTFDVLVKCNLPNVRLLQLSKLETSELLGVKRTRSKVEYCWTLTPFAPRFVFEADKSVNRVTYLDADVWFRKHPYPIFQEFENSGKQILITDHAYAPEHDQSAIAGQYCVQFLIITRLGGEIVRKSWEDQCIAWCYARYEDDKFGDQKYLDQWPLNYPEHVHILMRKELLLAPWNATVIPYGQSVLFHFHGLRILSKNRVMFDFYPRPKVLFDNVYKKYLVDIRQSLIKLNYISFNINPQKIVSVFFGYIYFRYIQINIFMKSIFPDIFAKF